MGRSPEVYDIPGADPEVVETIKGLLGDDPQAFLARREAEELQDVQRETRQRQEMYYDKLRRQTVLGRLAIGLRKHLKTDAGS
jgi:hypothetical protein